MSERIGRRKVVAAIEGRSGIAGELLHRAASAGTGGAEAGVHYCAQTAQRTIILVKSRTSGLQLKQRHDYGTGL